MSAILTLPFLLTSLLSAQQLVTFNVTVTDPSGGAIAQARGSLRNEETRAKRNEISSGTGLAVIPGLPAGRYQLTVESDQFSPFQTPVVLSVGQNASVSVTLEIKTKRETVDVQETVEGIDTQNSEVSQVFDSAKIADLQRM